MKRIPSIVAFLTCLGTAAWLASNHRWDWEPALALFTAISGLVGLEYNAALRQREEIDAQVLKVRGPTISIAEVQLTLEQAVRHARIAFVDDEGVPMASILRERGYNVVDLDDVVHIEDVACDKYSLLFLDVSGVGRSLFKTEGAGVAQAIRSRFSVPYIVVYSAVPTLPGKESSLLLRKYTDDELEKAANVETYEKKIEKWCLSYYCGATLVKLLVAISGQSEADVRAKLTAQEPFRIAEALQSLAGGNTPESRAVRSLAKALLSESMFSSAKKDAHS